MDSADKEQQKELYEKRLQQMQMEMQKKELLRKMLDDKAYERMMNVRISSPELYEKVVSSLAYMAQSGRVSGKITEKQVYDLLLKLTQRKETSIEYKKK